MNDPLEMFWYHTVLVRRCVGNSAAGPQFAPPTGERGNLAVKRQMVRDGSGDEVTSSATIVFPRSIAYIPPGSEVDLPTEFGGGTADVVSVAVSNQGPPFPDTQVVDC